MILPDGRKVVVDPAPPRRYTAADIADLRRQAAAKTGPQADRPPRPSPRHEWVEHVPGGGPPQWVKFTWRADQVTHWDSLAYMAFRRRWWHRLRHGRSLRGREEVDGTPYEPTSGERVLYRFNLHPRFATRPRRFLPR